MRKIRVMLNFFAHFLSNMNWTARSALKIAKTVYLYYNSSFPKRKSLFEVNPRKRKSSANDERTGVVNNIVDRQSTPTIK